MPDRCQNLSPKGGELEQNIPLVIGGNVRRGEVAERIAMRSNMLDQPGGLSLLRLLAPPVQF